MGRHGPYGDPWVPMEIHPFYRLRRIGSIQADTALKKVSGVSSLPTTKIGGLLCGVGFRSVHGSLPSKQAC